MREEEGLSRRGLCRIIADMYLRMAPKAPSPALRQYYLTQACEWQAKAVAPEQQETGQSSQPVDET